MSLVKEKDVKVVKMGKFCRFEQCLKSKFGLPFDNKDKRIWAEKGLKDNVTPKVLVKFYFSLQRPVPLYSENVFRYGPKGPRQVVFT